MMSPENYCLIEKTARNLIARIDLYIEGGTAEGLVNPVVFFDDIKNLSDEISEAIGICYMATKNAKTLSVKQKYQALLQDLRVCRERLGRDCLNSKY